MNRVVTSCINPSFFSLDALETVIMTNHVIVKPTTIANRALTGTARSECATEGVMTPVIVPELAANRINGVNEVSSVSDAGDDVVDALPLSIRKPIHISTMPPAT
jgi:hypothetical protein